MARDNLFNSKLYRGVRWIHAHAGLFFGPVALLFAVSTLILNHPQLFSGWMAREEVERVFEGIQVPDSEGLSFGRSIAQQLDLTGEIDWVGIQPDEKRVTVMISRPGWYTRITVKGNPGRAELVETRKGFLDRILYLHKRPGPHVANLRGNWWVVKLWGTVADSLILSVLSLSLTGILLWWRLKNERAMGLGATVAGFTSLTVLIWLLVGG